jgi:hypothetical protein
MGVITVDIVPTPIWTVAAKSNAPLLLVNLDSSANITIGDSSVTPADTGAQTIPPQGAMSVPATQVWYAISDVDNSPQMQVTLGGGDWAASPAGIAEAMIAAGIPTLIAQQLSASGISLLAAPQQLYNIGGVPTPGSAFTSLVGWSVPTQSFKTGCYYHAFAGINQQDQGDSAFQALVQRGLPNNRPPVVKKFWNPGEYQLGGTIPFNNMANYYSYGTTVIVCIQPLMNGNAIIASETTAISNFCDGLIALGANSTNTIFVLWQEPEVKKQGIPKATQTQYTNGHAGYGPTIIAKGFPIVLDIGSGAGVNIATAYADAGFASGIAIAGLASDYYAPVFNNTGTAILTAMAAKADAHAVPYGIYELGVAPANFPGNPNLAAQYLDAITNFFQQRQINGKPNGHFLWYDGQCDATGAGDLTAPILNAGDTRIPHYRALFDTLTSSASSGTGGQTIGASSTVTLTPSNPSPVGGLASLEELSYEISLGLIAGVGSTNPFAHIIVTWYQFDQKAANQTIVDQTGYYVPMGTNGDANGPLVIHGSGRQRGSFMTIKINNFDSVACTLQFLQFVETGRLGGRDDWRWDVNNANSPNVPNFTRANAGNGSLEVGRVTGQTVIHGGGSKSWLCGIFAGKVGYKISVPTGSTANDVVFQIAPQPTNIFAGSPTYLQESLGNAGNTNQRGELILPRCPVLVTVTNNEPANDVTVSFSINALET